LLQIGQQEQDRRAGDDEARLTGDIRDRACQDEKDQRRQEDRHAMTVDDLDRPAPDDRADQSGETARRRMPSPVRTRFVLRFLAHRPPVSDYRVSRKGCSSILNPANRLARARRGRSKFAYCVP